MVHVYPLNDIYEHKLEGCDCKCNPCVDIKNELVLHYAFDGRDLIDELEGKPVIDLPDGGTIAAQ